MRSPVGRYLVAVLALTGLLAAGPLALAVPGDLILASTSDEGIKADSYSHYPSLSADGTKVAFDSTADNLDPAGIYGGLVYVKDLLTGDITLASSSDTGTPGSDNFGSYFPSLSADGTKVAFLSYSNVLDPADRDQIVDVYVKDVLTGDISLVSTSAAGVKSNGYCDYSSLSADGTSVAFAVTATNLDPSDTDSIDDVYVKDLVTGDLVLASTSDEGVKGNGASTQPRLSGGGTMVAFVSTSTNLDPADPDTLPDVYVKNLVTGDIALVSSSDAGIKGNSESLRPFLSADGTSVAFDSGATNLDPADADGFVDVYVKNLATGDLTLASTSDAGANSNGGSFRPSLSPEGTVVAFDSDAANLDSADGNAVFDVYVKNLQTGDIALASARDAAGKGTRSGNGGSYLASLSSDGARVAFESAATNLTYADRDGEFDIYVKELGGPLPSGADVAVALSAGPDPAVRGRTLASVMAVVNHGPDAATGTTLSAPLPEGTAFVAVTASRGSCTVQVEARTVICQLGSIPVHISASVRLVIRPIQLGSIGLRALVSANESDADPTNNSAAVSVTILAG